MPSTELKQTNSSGRLSTTFAPSGKRLYATLWPRSEPSFRLRPGCKPPLTPGVPADTSLLSPAMAGLDAYINLLLHLTTISTQLGWDHAKREIDFYCRKWELIRNNSAHRLIAMCRIYITLRDGAEAEWLSPKLEAEKMTTLMQKVAALEGNTRGGGPGVGFCDKCQTILHGSKNCPWNSLSNGKARAKGKDALKKLAGAAGAADGAVSDGE
jgi:hypothetical protein